MGIFSRIRERKDPTLLKKLNCYLNLATRLAEKDASIQFFEDCIVRNLYPRLFHKQLRRSRIRPDSVSLKRHTCNHLDTLRSEMAEFERLLNQQLPVAPELSHCDRRDFLEYVDSIIKKRVKKKTSALEKGLNELKPVSSFPNNPDRYVHNLSNVVLDDTLLEVLSLGPKFCCPHNRIDPILIETQFENVYNQTSDLTPSSDFNLGRFKSDLVNCSYRYTMSKVRPDSPVTKKHLDALKQLRTRTDILLTKPDKGSGIVLMDKKNYLDKMHDLLNDETKFCRSDNDKDRTNVIEGQLTNCLKRLKNQALISDQTFERIRPVGTLVPRLYGLPKIHKEGTPMRPILDMYNSPYHATAKWLAGILEPLRRHLCKYSLRDSFEFVEALGEIDLNSKQMCSFDVSSLFTNVPLLDTINFICDFIDSNSFTIALPTSTLRELLLRCTFNIQFKFNGHLYQQTDGVAMGSPLGPLLSDIFMSSLEEGSLHEAIQSMCFYRRYVDDIFIILDGQTDTDYLLNSFNDVHPTIRFTAEFEKNDSFNFLDVLLIRRSDGTLKRSVYRKPTWTGQYTHFRSFVPLQQKRNLIRTLTHRARLICSPDTLEAELLHITDVLKENGYPDRFIMRHMADSRKPDVTQKAERKPIYISLPFRGDLAADSLNRRLHSSLRQTFPAATLKSWFTTRPLLRLNLKDIVPVHSQNMLVYSFICSCAAEYVGRTTRQLKERMKEHNPPWLRSGDQKSVRSAVVAHLVESGHPINSDASFRVLYKAPHNLPRSIQFRCITTAEAVAIRLRDPVLCHQKRFVQALRLPWPPKTERVIQTSVPAVQIPNINIDVIDPLPFPS